MSLRKDMTLNEMVFRQNINNGPSIVIWTYLSIYSYFIIYRYVGYFRNYLIENIQLWMLQWFRASFGLSGPLALILRPCIIFGL